jgi:hypothetical protein
MKHIRKFDTILEDKKISDLSISSNKSVYNDLVAKAGEEVVEMANEHFEELRFNFLRYMMRGDGFDASIEGATYDVFEGYSLVEEITEDIINYLKVLLVFGGTEEFEVISQEF